MFKVCVIGCGGISIMHGTALAAMKNVQLAACCDIVEEKARAFGEKYHCRVYTDYLDMMDREKPDAVHLCTPHYLHTPMAMEAAKRGIHVFSEKPPVISWQQWEKLQQAGQQVRLGFCFQNRYNPSVEKARALLAAGEIGAVKGVRGIVNWDRGADYYALGDWRGKWATEGGGVLINQAIHTLDLMLLFFGKPDRVEAYMANRHLKGVIEVEDTVEAYLEAEGKRGLFFVSNAYTADAQVLVEVIGEKGSLMVSEDTLEVKIGDRVERQQFEMPTPVGKKYWGSGHFACIQDFYAAMEKGEAYRNDLDSVKNTVETMLKIYDQGRKTLQ